MASLVVYCLFPGRSYGLIVEKVCCPLDSIPPSTLKFFQVSLVSEYILTYFEDLFHYRDEFYKHTFLWSLLLL